MFDGVKSILRSALPAPIRRSYLLKFALATGLVLLIIGAVGYETRTATAETLREDVRQSLTSQTQTEADGLADFIESKRLPVKLVSDDSVFRNESNTAVMLYLQHQQETKFSIDVTALHYVDLADGRIVASTSTSRAQENVTDEPWFDRWSFDGPNDVVVGETYLGTANLTKIAFASPVNGVEDHALVMTLNADSVNDRFSSTINGSFTEVVDTTGTVQFASEESLVLGQYAASNASMPMVEAGLAGESGFVRDSNTVDAQRGTHVAAYAPVNGTDWVVVHHAPASAAYRITQQVDSGILLLLAIALVGVVAIGATIGRNTARSVTRLSEQAAEIEGGTYDVALETARVDELGQLYDSIGRMRDTLVEQLETAEDARERADEARDDAEAARERAETARQEAQQLTEHLEAKAAAYSEVMAACEAGDLTRRLDAESDSEAMRSIATAFNAMLDEWQTTIESVQAFAGDVDTASQDTAATVQEIETASAGVSESAETISAAAQEQHEHVDTVSEEMSNLSATVEEITATATSVAEIAEETEQIGQDGQTAATAALEELSAIERQTDQAVGTVEELHTEMDQIRDIVEIIRDIAEETSVLALNANIEAARAGESGDGFAIVADEVKSLAEETSSSAAEIESRIEDVTERTDETVNEMREVRQRVRTGSETVESALNALDTVADHATDTNSGVQEIRRSTEQQADSAQRIAAMADELSDIADETTSETDAVEAAAKDQTEAIAEVTDRVERLSTQARQLQTELERFETNATASSGADTEGAAADGGSRTTEQ